MSMSANTSATNNEKDGVGVGVACAWMPAGAPNKILCVARNYAAHAAELHNAVPSSPFFFLKPSSSLLPHHNWCVCLRIRL